LLVLDVLLLLISGFCFSAEAFVIVVCLVYSLQFGWFLMFFSCWWFVAVAAVVLTQ
jgi:hypothetical protein